MAISCLKRAFRYGCNLKSVTQLLCSPIGPVTLRAVEKCLCSFVLNVCPHGITDVHMSNHSCATDSPVAPQPAQNTTRGDTFGIGKHVPFFSSGWKGSGKIDLRSTTRIQITSYHATQCLLDIQPDIPKPEELCSLL